MWLLMTLLGTSDFSFRPHFQFQPQKRRQTFFCRLSCTARHARHDTYPNPTISQTCHPHRCSSMLLQIIFYCVLWIQHVDHLSKLSISQTPKWAWAWACQPPRFSSFLLQNKLVHVSHQCLYYAQFLMTGVYLLPIASVKSMSTLLQIMITSYILTKFVTCWITH